MISAIILTFNSKDHISACLDSIFKQSPDDLEVIIVDNGSSDNTVELIRENYPQVKLICNNRNLGTCKARNQAIAMSKGEWILTLDCDTVLDKAFFRSAASLLTTISSDVGIIQPKIMKLDKETIDSCGIRFSRLCRFYDIGKGKSDGPEFSFSKYIFGACSACAFYRRKMLDKIKEGTGYFDESFFFLVEDVDLAWRAKRTGWKAIFTPVAIAYHHGQAAKISKKLRQYFCFMNRYKMIKKNKNLSGRLRLLILGFWYELFRFLYMLFTNPYLITGNRK